MSDYFTPNFRDRRPGPSSVYSAQPNPYNQVVRFGPTSEAGSGRSDGRESYFGDPSWQHGSSSHPYTPSSEYMPSPQPLSNHFQPVYSPRESGYSSRSTHKRSMHQVSTSISYGDDTPRVASKFMSATFVTTQDRKGRQQTRGYVQAARSGGPYQSTQTSKGSGRRDPNSQYGAGSRYAYKTAQSRQNPHLQPPRTPTFLPGFPQGRRPATSFAPRQATYHALSDLCSKSYPTPEEEAGHASSTALLSRQQPTRRQQEPSFCNRLPQTLIPSQLNDEQENDNIDTETIDPWDSISVADLKRKRRRSSVSRSRPRSSNRHEYDGDLEAQYWKIKREVDTMRKIEADNLQTRLDKARADNAAWKLNADKRRVRRGV